MLALRVGGYWKDKGVSKMFGQTDRCLELHKCSDRQTDIRNDKCSDRQTDVRKDILREISEKVVKLKIFYLCTDLSANNFIRSAMTQGVQICA